MNSKNQVNGSRNTLKVLIVDDTIFYRKILRSIFSDIPSVEVIGEAGNGKDALRLIIELSPDLVAMDLEMPIMDGYETLVQIKRQSLDTTVLIVSSHTRPGADATIKCLELGALDFIGKPDGDDLKANRDELAKQLKRKVTLAHSKILLRKAKLENFDGFRRQEMQVPAEIPASESSFAAIRPAIVAMGISTGGPSALATIIPMFPERFHLPILIVQHMPEMFTGALANSLDRKSRLKVVEASNDTLVIPGQVYIAPGGKQMGIRRGGGGSTVIKITDDPPEHHCKPSADYLFRTVADTYGASAIGVVMTGMGSDGTTGLQTMKDRGAFTIAQDMASSVVFGMPMSAISAGAVSSVLPLDRIPDKIMALAGPMP